MKITTQICRVLLLIVMYAFSMKAQAFGQQLTTNNSVAVDSITANNAAANNVTDNNATDDNVGGRDPSRQAVCRRGEPRCVDLVIREMARRWRRLDRACDHRAPFALLYLLTTEEFRRSLKYLAYDDPAAVIREDAYFASLYFKALDDPTNAPGAWRVAESAAAAGTQTVAGDLILGVNAHVQRDLAFTLYDVYKQGYPVSYEDHTLVNEFLRRVDSNAEIRERYDPAFGTVPDDGSSRSELVIQWREVAFRNYERLRDARTDDERAIVVAEIEAYSTIVAQSLQAATLAPDEGAARDSYCQTSGK